MQEACLRANSPASGPRVATYRQGRAEARDIRLDFCRGLAFIFIFIDHTATNVLSRLTMLNFGLCDAAEVFVLLAGISAALAYGGKPISCDRFASRAASIYSTHIGLLVLNVIILYGAWRATGAPVIRDHETLAAFMDGRATTCVKALLLFYSPS